MDEELLISALKIFSLRSGEEFILASGEKSTVYVDVKKTAFRGTHQKLLGKMLWEKLDRSFSRFPNPPIDTIAGVALGGCHLSSVTALQAPYNIDVMHVRKEAKDHGTQNLLECSDDCSKYSIESPRQVVLIEDVVTTGGSSVRAAFAIEQAGHNVVGIVTVVDRRKEKSPYLTYSTYMQWPIVALVNFEQLL